MRLAALLAAAALAAVLASAAGPPPAAPPPPSYGWIVPNRYGVVGDGKTDCSPAMQALVDRLTGPATFAFEQGRYRFSWPVLVDKAYVKVQGCGRGVTELSPSDGVSAPPLVFGFRRADAGGDARPAHRPDAFGLLDASLAPRPGAFRGLASDGDGYAGFFSSGAQLGCWRAPPGPDRRPSWSYWADPEGFTLEFALLAPDGVAALGETHVIGLGAAREPGPWDVGVTSDGLLCVRWFSADQAAGANLPARDLRAAVPGKGLLRVRVAWDHPNGLCTLSAGGRELARLAYPKGLAFAPARGHLPFWAGPSPSPAAFDRSRRALPRFALLAWKVTLGVAPEAADDLGRYGVDPLRPHDGRTVTALLGGQPCPQPRAVPAYAWPGPDGWARTYGFLGLAAGTWLGVEGQSVRDMTFAHGPLAVSQALHFRARDVEAKGGAVGLASVPAEAAFPLSFTDCDFSGSDAGVSLTRALVSLSNVDVSQGGAVYARFAHSGGSWRGGFLGNPGPRPRAAVALVNDDYGGVWWPLEGLTVDNESEGFSEAALVATAGLKVRLRVSGLDASRLGPGACGVLLLGDRWGDAPAADVSGVWSWSGDASTRVAGRGWVVNGRPAGVGTVPAAKD